MSASNPTRRAWLGQATLGTAALAISRFAPATFAAAAPAPLELGSRLELFLDRHLIDRLTATSKWSRWASWLHAEFRVLDLSMLFHCA